MRKLIAVLALATIAACGSDSASSSSSFEGTWSLNTVNSAPLPFTFYQDASEKDEVVTEILNVSAGRVYDHVTYRYTPTGGAAQTSVTVDTATYTQTGNSIKIKYSASDSLMGTLTGSTFTASVPGATAVFVKQ